MDAYMLVTHLGARVTDLLSDLTGSPFTDRITEAETGERSLGKWDFLSLVPYKLTNRYRILPEVAAEVLFSFSLRLDASWAKNWALMSESPSERDLLSFLTN